MTGLGLLSQLTMAVVVFASTNVDDVVLLSVLFAEPGLRARAVVLGQFAGIGVLVAVSVVAALAALVVPEGWAAILGLAPLFLGLWKLREWLRGDEDEDATAPSAAGDAAQIAAVALITIANGGDNVGVYVPLFADDPSVVPVYTAVFGIMTGAMCWAGYRLVNNRVMGEQVKRYGHAVLPFVLIALGVYVLAGLRALWA